MYACIIFQERTGIIFVKLSFQLLWFNSMKGPVVCSCLRIFGSGSVPDIADFGDWLNKMSIKPLINWTSAGQYTRQGFCNERCLPSSLALPITRLNMLNTVHYHDLLSFFLLIFYIPVWDSLFCCTSLCTDNARTRHKKIRVWNNQRSVP